MLNRRIDELVNLRKGYNFIEFPLDLRLSHTENGSIQEYVLTSGELRMKSGAHFEQRADPAIDIGITVGRICDSRQNLEQGTLAGAIAADDADDLTSFDLEGNIFDGPDGLVQLSRAAGLAAQKPPGTTKRGRRYVNQLIRQSVVILLRAANVVFLAQSRNINRQFAHESHLQHICKALFHPPEIKGTAEQQDERDRG